MAQASRDQNNIPTLLAASNADGFTPVRVYADPTTHRLLVDLGGGGTGTVTSVSVVTANGFAGTVATATTTPAITLTTTVTGILKGNGTAISAAAAGTDYQAPITLTTTGTSGAATFIANTLNIPNYATGGSGTVNSGTAGQLTYYAGTGTAVSGNANATISAGALTLGVATSVQGQLILSGVTSGTTTLTTAAAASGTLTLPAATDTLVGKATTDTLTNKTFNTAGAGNVLQINGTGITAINGSGAVVLTTSATLITPILGVAAATTINKVTITAPATGSTLTIADGKTLTQNATQTFAGVDGKTLTFNNSLTFAGTDATTMTFPGTSKTIAANDGSNWTLTSQAIGDILTASSTTAYTRVAAVAVGQVLISAGTGTQPVWSAQPQLTGIELGNATDTTLSRSAAGVLAVEGVVIPSISSTNTLTNKRITRRLVTVNAPGATPSTNTDNVDIANFTGLNAAITSMSTNLTGTRVDGDLVEFRFTDDGTARAITWGASFGATTVALPTTTVISTMLRVLFEYNGTILQCIAVA